MTTIINLWRRLTWRESKALRAKNLADAELQRDLDNGYRRRWQSSDGHPNHQIEGPIHTSNLQDGGVASRVNCRCGKAFIAFDADSMIDANETALFALHSHIQQHAIAEEMSP
jgi:hypothetical protein